MSIASLGIVAGLAGTQLPQRAAEAEKVQQGAAEQSRAAEGAAAANPPRESARRKKTRRPERDADGRRLWSSRRATGSRGPSEVQSGFAAALQRPDRRQRRQLDLVG
jgi:hypothetical protein